MSVPLLGPMTLSGFAHKWFLLFLLVVVGLVGFYIVVQLARQRRMLRFANMELLESVAPNRPTQLRHLPSILLMAALLLLTIAMAGPTHDVRIPRNRAVVMLVIDVSQSMRATDVPPNRLGATQDAAKEFADKLTPGINLGLIAYAGTATVLVSPTTNREATKIAIDKLQLADRTATGEGIFTALQAIATVGAVIGGGDDAPLKKVAQLSAGTAYNASNVAELKNVYTSLQQQIGYETIKGDASVGWLRLGALTLALAALAALLSNHRLPTRAACHPPCTTSTPAA